MNYDNFFREPQETTIFISKTENGYHLSVKKYVMPEKKELPIVSREEIKKQEDDLFSMLSDTMAETIKVTKQEDVDTKAISESIKKLFDVSKRYQELKYSHAYSPEECIAFPRKEEKSYVFKQEDFADFMSFLHTQLQPQKQHNRYSK